MEFFNRDKKRCAEVVETHVGFLLVWSKKDVFRGQAFFKTEEGAKRGAMDWVRDYVSPLHRYHLD